MNELDPVYLAPMEPQFPCRVMFTRHCPVIYGDVCGVRPCARYESDDETPWTAEVARSEERRKAHRCPCAECTAARAVSR